MSTCNSNRYSDAEIAAIYRVIYERRDMRHFLPDKIDPKILARLFQAMHQAPSVGFMQPWRFVRISDSDLRQALYELVEQERYQTAAALHERGSVFMQLKVEGILECAEVWVAALCEQRDQYVFGRRTLPEMDLASLACAIQNLWLAARAEGLGLGWVSLFEPTALKVLLNMPQDSQPVAILCLGHVETFYEQPLLAQKNWEKRCKLDALLFENYWANPDSFFDIVSQNL